MGLGCFTNKFKFPCLVASVAVGLSAAQPGLKKREGGISSPEHGVGRPECEVQLVCLPAVRPCTNCMAALGPWASLRRIMTWCKELQNMKPSSFGYSLRLC